MQKGGINENKIKRRLIVLAVAVVFISITLCAAGVGVLHFVLRNAHEAEHIQMQIEVMEYKARILKQMNKNMQILTTFANMCQISGIVNSEEKMGQGLEAANKSSSFLSIAYISSDGWGAVNASKFGTMYDFSLEDRSEESKEAMRKAFQGENAVSKLFDSAIYQEKLFVYAVPVYDEAGEIIGVVAASDTIEIFNDIANGNTVMGGEGYVHIIDDQGNFLVRSENTLVKENMKSIFDGPYLSDDTKSITKTKLLNHESVIGEFSYNNEKCHYYIESMGFNGWNLFCANKLWGSILPLGRIIIMIGCSVFVLLSLMLFLLYFGYYKIRKNTSILLRHAYIDPVTGAKNSLRFAQDFEEFQKKHKDYSIIAINIHNFKFINDLFGNSGGDKALCYIKRVIEENIKDVEFFCRESADLFYVLMLDVDEDKLISRIEKIVNTVKKATGNAEYSYEISLYSGVAIRGDTAKALLAMQSIQRKLYTSVAVYNEELHESLRNKNNIERYMQTALQNEEFKLFLQPKFDLKNNCMVGAEALVRWQKPDGTYRYPGEFIPIFEANGFCLKLDMYMVDLVCRQLRLWIDSGVTPFPISINQSKLLFFNGNYVNDLLQVINRYRISPSLITLEILEGVAMSSLEEINHRVEELHSKGFKVSMDDFGSGYSSLNMLYQLRIDELKLDRAFLQRGAGGNENDERRKIILEHVISTAKELGIRTVAEGIETEYDKNTMKNLGCDYGQGYFYSKPVSAQDFISFYSEQA